MGEHSYIVCRTQLHACLPPTVIKNFVHPYIMIVQETIMIYCISVDYVFTFDVKVNIP